MPFDKTNYLFDATGNLTRLYEDLTQFALDDIVDRILENKVITPTAEYRIWRLQQLGLHLDEIKRYISKMTGKSNKEIDKIFKEYGLKYYRSVQQISVDNGRNFPLTVGTSQLMSDIFSYYVAATKGTVKNLTATTANSSQKLLIDELDKVHFSVMSGMRSYSEAIREAVDEVGRTSLKVAYPTGHKNTVETAVRRAVVTGVNKCFSDLNLVRAKENGYGHVLVSSHLGARHIENPNPTYLSHDLWQGKVYQVDWQKVSIMNKKDALEGTNDKRSIDNGGVNFQNGAAEKKSWKETYKKLNPKLTNVSQIGVISQKVISALNLNLKSNLPILIGENNYKHMLEKHPNDFVKYSQNIQKILANPDFVGINPKNRSLEYVKEFKIDNDFVKVAVRVSGKGNNFVRTMYTIPDYRVKKFLKTGRFKRVD